MTDRTSDDERLAALLDGRTVGPQRGELLAHLARADEDYDVFADTAAVLRELEEGGEAGEGEEAGTRVLPLRPRRRRAPAAGWLAAAAVLVGVLLAGGLLRPRAPLDAVRLAARLEHAGEGLPAGWIERAPWTATRGGSAPTGQAARAGALLADLAVAVEAEDAVETRLLALQAAARFDPQGGRDGPLARLAARAGEPPAALRPLVAEAGERIGERMGPDALAAGAWAEAARLAAHRRDEGFFRGREARAMLRRVERAASADPSAAGAAAEVRALLEGGAPPRWDALSGALDRLLAALGSHPAPPPT